MMRKTSVGVALSYFFVHSHLAPVVARHVFNVLYIYFGTE